MPFNRVLVPTDFSAGADAALDHAVSMAGRFQASLHLLHVVNDPGAGLYGLGEAELRMDRLKEEAEKRARERLRELAQESSAVEVHPQVVRQSRLGIGKAVQEYAEAHEVDLVVMGTHGRRGLERLVLGSVANTLIRQSNCPVMTVRERGDDTHTSDDVIYDKLLAPIDFSEYSRASLQLSKAVAHRYGGTQHLLFVAEKRVLPTFSDTGLPGVGVVEMDPEIVANAESALEALNDAVEGPEVESDYHVREGDVAEDIVDFAGTKAVNLIVMATRGLTGIDRFVIGSNTERVVRTAPCPVLTVPPPPAQRDE